MKKERNTQLPKDERNGAGQQHERWARLLSVDLDYMKEAFARKKHGEVPVNPSNFDVLADHFSETDFFLPEDEAHGYPNFPNLARFFSQLQLLDMQKHMPLSNRVLSWKEASLAAGGKTDFAAFYDFILSNSE